MLSIQALFSIIANRVGAESYENFSDDNMLNFKYEGTIRRQSGDLLRAVFFHVLPGFRIKVWYFNDDKETVKVQMIPWDLKAEDLFPPVHQIYHINKDITPDGSHHLVKRQVMLLIQDSF